MSLRDGIIHTIRKKNTNKHNILETIRNSQSSKQLQVLQIKSTSHKHDMVTLNRELHRKFGPLSNSTTINNIYPLLFIDLRSCESAKCLYE